MDFAQLFADVEARVGTAAPMGDRPDARPAPWLVVEEDQVDALVGRPRTPVELLERDAGGGDDAGWPDDRYDADWWFDAVGLDDEWIDAIAAYRPWHIHRWQWGIVVNEGNLGCFTEAIAEEAKVDAARVAPFALRQVLAHEYVHFSFEVAATEIEDILGEPRYLAYVSRRFGSPNRWTTGPLEEVIATWAESLYVNGLPARGPRCAPRGYVEAVRQVNRAAPPGYRDFELMADARRAERIVADVASLIADRDLWSFGWWPRVTPQDCAQVPLFWEGDPETQPLFGVGKSNAPPSIRVFEHLALLHGRRHTTPWRQAREGAAA